MGWMKFYPKAVSLRARHDNNDKKTESKPT
jgi:hypothetical protein